MRDRGKATSVMAAYNAVFDVPCVANPWLLTLRRCIWRRDVDYNLRAEYWDNRDYAIARPSVEGAERSGVDAS